MFVGNERIGSILPEELKEVESLKAIIHATIHGPVTLNDRSINRLRHDLLEQKPFLDALGKQVADDLMNAIIRARQEDQPLTFTQAERFTPPIDWKQRQNPEHKHTPRQSVMARRRERTNC